MIEDFDALVSDRGLIIGISFVKPRAPEGGKTGRGAGIRVQFGKKDTLLGFGITPAEFDKQYTRAIDLYLQWRGLEPTAEQRAVLEATKYSLLQHYGIRTKQITVFDFEVQVSPQPGAHEKE